MSVIDTAAVQRALDELSALVAAATPRAPVGGDGGEEQRRRLAWHLREYLLPRVRDLEAPLVAVLLGSTGTGKSSLLNGLARRRVSPSGVIRPTTVRPLALLAPGQVDAFMGGRVLAALADEDRVELAVDEQAVPEIVLVDAPDLDSVETANQLAADELLQAADLCLFVTTAQRYADAVPWEFLRRARERGIPLMVLVNRLPRDEADRDAVLADCRRRFSEAGFDDAGPRGELPFLGVVEGARDAKVDGLDAAAIEPLRRTLDELAADPRALGAVKAAALRGAMAGLPDAVGRLAGYLERDRQRAATLRAAVERAYAAEAAKLAERLAGGEFLRGEVMRAWQEFVGVGDVARWLSSGVGRVRAWLARRLRPRITEAPIEQAKERAFEQLVAALVEAHPELWGHGERLPAEAHELLTAWLGRLAKVVEERGQDRRAFAFVASLGVNAIGVVAMLAVFAHSAGLTGGELAIAGGTAVLNQKLLEALIGEAAVADIVRGADRDLHASLRAGLEADRARFLDLLAPGEAGPQELRAAAARVVAEAERLLAGLDGAERKGTGPAQG